VVCTYSILVRSLEKLVKNRKEELRVSSFFVTKELERSINLNTIPRIYIQTLMPSGELKS